MVKSNARPMPKNRKIQVDPELLKALEDLERRIRESDRKTAEVIARADQVLMRLRRTSSAR